MATQPTPRPPVALKEATLVFMIPETMDDTPENLLLAKDLMLHALEVYAGQWGPGSGKDHEIVNALLTGVTR